MPVFFLFPAPRHLPLLLLAPTAPTPTGLGEAQPPHLAIHLAPSALTCIAMLSRSATRSTCNSTPAGRPYSLSTRLPPTPPFRAPSTQFHPPSYSTPLRSSAGIPQHHHPGRWSRDRGEQGQCKRSRGAAALSRVCSVAERVSLAAMGMTKVVGSLPGVGTVMGTQAAAGQDAVTR